MRLKYLASNNALNARWKFLQDFLVQIQQSDWYVAFLHWYSSNNNSSAVPMSGLTASPKNFKPCKYILSVLTRNNTQNSNRNTPPYFSATLMISPRYKIIWAFGSKKVATSYKKIPLNVKIQWRWRGWSITHRKWIKTSSHTKSSSTPA